MDSTREAIRRRFRALLRRASAGPDGSARVGSRQIYIVPTPAGLFFGAVVLAMVLGSLNFQNNLGLLFGFFLAGVGLVAMHRCWFNLLDLLVQVRGGEPVFLGAPAELEVVLRNTRSSERFDLRVLGAAPEHLGVDLQARQQRACPLRVPTRRRGLLTLSEVEIETRHPMHLFRAWCYVETRGECLVYPRPADYAPLTSEGSGDAGVKGRVGLDGQEDFLGPREYRAGDPPRRLDWKAMARERGLVVKEFGSEPRGALWADWFLLGGRDVERRIELLTRQVLDASEAGRRFGLRLPGIEVPVGFGVPHLRVCLKELALFNAEETAHDAD